MGADRLCGADLSRRPGPRRPAFALLAAAFLLTGTPATATTGSTLGRFGGWLLKTAPQMSFAGRPMPPMRYQGWAQTSRAAVRWAVEFQEDRLQITAIGRQGCSRTEHRSTAGLDDRRLAGEIEAVLSLHTAQLQLAGCIARPSTAVLELRRTRRGLLAMLRAMRTIRRTMGDPMA